MTAGVYRFRSASWRWLKQRQLLRLIAELRTLAKSVGLTVWFDRDGIRYGRG